MSPKKQTIALDFDGVLHDYHGWNGGRLAGPLPGARRAVEALTAQGFEVIIFSTRDADQIRPWLEQHGFPPLEVTAEKRPYLVLIDDRAIEFRGRWDQGLLHRIANFRPHWEKAGA